MNPYGCEVSGNDILLMLMGEDDSGHSEFIDIMTGRSRPPSHQQSRVEAIRVPGRDRLVLVDTPPLTSVSEPPELDIIGRWLVWMNEFEGVRLTGVIYMFSGRSAKSRVKPSTLLQAFQQVASNVILVVNTTDPGLWTQVLSDKLEEIERQFRTMKLLYLDLPLYRKFNGLTSAVEITNYSIRGRDNVRLVLDNTRSGFRLVLDKTFRVPRAEDNWSIIKRRTARNAFYEKRSDADTVFLTGTTRLREDIMDWVVGKISADAHILFEWLAGIDVSTLAGVLADSCRTENLLLATFSFSRCDSNLMNALVATIVEQIGNASPLAKELVTEAMEDQGVLSAPFVVQLNRLVLQPLLKLGVSNFPRLIIINDLDNSNGPRMLPELVNGIVASRQSLTNTEYPLRFVVFSQPNNNLRDTFALVPNYMVHRVMMSGKQWLRIGGFSAPRAIHSSQERYDPPKCHPNTRVAIRDRLMEWATQKTLTTKDPRILWFYGGPGTGKSAVAQTLAETLHSQNLLLATFFFSRTDSTRNTINPLAATIAFQIGTIIPDLQKLIVKALDNNPRLMNEPFEAQLRNLVLQPLAEFTTDNETIHVPQVIILDGLDECFDPEMQRQIIISLAGVAKSGEHPLRVLIVSRPEDHLEDVFNTRVPNTIVHRLALDGSCISDDDIRVFLQGRLDTIKQAHPKRDSFDKGWPNPTAIEQLVRRSHGQFIHASMIIKYISSSANPAGCLDNILGLRCRLEDEGMLSSELDLLYCYILSSVKDIEMMKMIVGVILFVDPDYDFFARLTSIQPSAAQTLPGIEMLIGLNHGQAARHISELHPMIQYDNDGNIFVSHATITEFFHDYNRSKSFHIDRKHILNTLVDRCLQIIRNGDDHLSTQYAYGRLPQLCMKIPWTSGLSTSLMDFRVFQCHQWCERNASRICSTLAKDHNLFPWWYVTRFLMLLRKLEEAEAYSYHLSAFDKLIYLSLSRYHFEDFQLLLALTSIFMPFVNLTYERFLTFLGCLQVKNSTLKFDESMGGIGLLSFYRDGRSDDDCFRLGQHRSCDIVVDVYHQLLLDFFNDPVRSEKFCLSPMVFASAASRCRRFICRVQGAATTAAHIDGIEIAYSFLPRLLLKAGKSDDLLSFLQQAR